MWPGNGGRVGGWDDGEYRMLKLETVVVINEV